MSRQEAYWGLRVAGCWSRQSSLAAEPQRGEAPHVRPQPAKVPPRGMSGPSNTLVCERTGDVEPGGPFQH